MATITTVKHFKELTNIELYDIMALRQMVFVVEQTCYYLDADGKDLDSWHLMVCDINDRLIAYSRILPKGISYDDYASIGRVASHPLERGTGMCKLLLEQSIMALYYLLGKQPIKIGAQCYLIKFYENFGFVVQGEPYLEDDIPHIKMVLS